MFWRPWLQSCLCTFFMKSSYRRLRRDILHFLYIPYIQCKMSLREPNSVRNVDGLSLIFIDFYVWALTPRLSRTETSLQLSENPLCGLSHIDTCHQRRDLDRYQMFRVYRLCIYTVQCGDRTEPCCTFAFISLGVDTSPCTETLNFLCRRK
jgi:hypothetical protein